MCVPQHRLRRGQHAHGEGPFFRTCREPIPKPPVCFVLVSQGDQRGSMRTGRFWDHVQIGEQGRRLVSTCGGARGSVNSGMEACAGQRLSGH